MSSRFALCGLILLSGCASAEPPLGGEDDAAPVINVTAPGFATLTTERTLRITGSVTDDYPGVSLTIGGQEFPLSNRGDFDAEIALEEGAQLITITATDAAGQTTSEVRTALSGVLRSPDSPVPDAVVVSLGRPALAAIGQEVIGVLGQVDLYQTLSTLNPLYSKGGGCNRASVDIRGLTYAGIEGSLEPLSDELEARAVLTDVVIDLRADYRLVCLGGVQDMTITIDELAVTLGATIDPDVDGSVAVGQSDIETKGVVASVGNSALDAFLSTFDDRVVSALAGSLEGMVSEFLVEKLGGFVDRQYTQTLAGQHYRYQIWPTAAQHGEDGVRVVINGLVKTDDTTEDWLATPGPMPEGMAPLGDNVLAISDDIVNQMTTSMWAAGAFHISISGDEFPLPAGADRVDVDLLLPPLAIAVEGETPKILIAEATATARAGENTVASLSLQLELGIVAGAGGLGLAVEVLDEQVVRRVGDSRDVQLIEAGAAAASILMVKRVNEAVAGIALPPLGGQNVVPSVSAADGYFMVHVTLPEEP